MTADYYSILRKAVVGLGQPDETARYKLYERARQVVVSQLRGADPPWPASDIDAQVEAFNFALARLEREFKNERAGPTPPRSASFAHDPPLEHASQAPDARAVFPRRRGAMMAMAGVSAAILLAGLGAYYVVSRDRAPPHPSVRPAEPARSSPAGTARVPSSSVADPAQAPYMLRQQRVYYRTTHPAGTVIISRDQKFLYLVQPNQVAVRYAIGIGPECVSVAGLFHITGKVGRPGADESQAQGLGAALPPNRKGEMEARFGPRALYFGGGHAVHGTTEPGRVGQSASFGCFHQWNEDIVGLYDRVPLNERVVVAN